MPLRSPRAGGSLESTEHQMLRLLAICVSHCRVYQRSICLSCKLLSLLASIFLKSLWGLFKKDDALKLNWVYMQIQKLMAAVFKVIE